MSWLFHFKVLCFTELRTNLGCSEGTCIWKKQTTIVTFYSEIPPTRPPLYITMSHLSFRQASCLWSGNGQITLFLFKCLSLLLQRNSSPSPDETAAAVFLLLLFFSVLFLISFQQPQLSFKCRLDVYVREFYSWDWLCECHFWYLDFLVGGVDQQTIKKPRLLEMLQDFAAFCSDDHGVPYSFCPLLLPRLTALTLPPSGRTLPLPRPWKKSLKNYFVLASAK